MPKRQTKRGDERTPLSGSYDVIVCGASFAGLTVARQLTGSGARVLVVTADRGLRARLPDGVVVAGPGWLNSLLGR